MENWEGLTITLGALAANMRDIVRELDKTVGPVEVDYVSASNTTAMVIFTEAFLCLARLSRRTECKD